MKIILIPGALVGASGMLALADRLLSQGVEVSVPDVLSAAGGMPDWPDWPKLLIKEARSPAGAILVGYSASTVLAAAIARRLSAAGLVLLDGDVPPDGGPVLPGSPRLRGLVADKAQPGARPLVWSDLFDDQAVRDALGLSQLEEDRQTFERFRAEQPILTPEWFEKPIDIEEWRDIPAAVLRTSRFGEAAAVEAETLGWPVSRLNGTHLHATLAPEETAGAILALANALGA